MFNLKTMKRTMKIIPVILFPILLKSFSFFNDPGMDKQKFPLTYMIMISSREEEKQASVLIKSIRKFGGKFSDEPVVIVLSDTIRALGESLKGNAIEIVKLDMNEILRRFPFSDKVYACAQVEKLVEGKTDWLVWLNPDALMIAPPEEIVSDKNACASLRPVHIMNIGSGFTEPLTEYWKKIYLIAGVDSNKIWPVKSYVDSKNLKPYFNSGCMAFRPEFGILREWKKVYETMLLDKDIYRFYSSDNNGAYFFHQAVLSAVLIIKAGQKKINILPASYGYPLVLQNSDDFVNKKDSVSEMKIILCGNYNNLNLLIPEEPYNIWFKENLK